jgi:hypothetical protein
MRNSRTLKLASGLKDLKQNAEAQFYVVLAPGTGRNAQVSDVKFIRGDERLRLAGGVLKSANFNLVFPDETATKLIRRGTLFCQVNGECSFFMITPDFVSSVD